MVYHRSSEGSSKQRPGNTFANDGSFMEMFKKMQEQQVKQPTSGSSKDSSKQDGNKKSDASSSHSAKKEGVDSSLGQESKPAAASKPLLVGKRRGGRFLATGKVKKLKAEGHEEDENPPKDAWSLYLAEVKKYKQTTCEEEGKTRPLVK